MTLIGAKLFHFQLMNTRNRKRVLPHRASSTHSPGVRLLSFHGFTTPQTVVGSSVFRVFFFNIPRLMQDLYLSPLLKNIQSLSIFDAYKCKPAPTQCSYTFLLYGIERGGVQVIVPTSQSTHSTTLHTESGVHSCFLLVLYTSTWSLGLVQQLPIHRSQPASHPWAKSSQTTRNRPAAPIHRLPIIITGSNLPSSLRSCSISTACLSSASSTICALLLSSYSQFEVACSSTASACALEVLAHIQLLYSSPPCSTVGVLYWLYLFTSYQPSYAYQSLSSHQYTVLQ